MTTSDADDDNALRDPALRRALDHAPDRDARPDPRTRDAIRKMAHNLAPVPAPSEASAAAMPWWRRLIGDGTKNRMPWSAAFATVLVAAFVTVLWQGEPVPDARLEGEAPIAQEPTPAPAAVPAPAPSGARSQREEDAAQRRTEAAREPAPSGAMADRAAVEVQRSAPPSPPQSAAPPAAAVAPAAPAPPPAAEAAPEPAPAAPSAAPARAAAKAQAAVAAHAPSFAALDRWTSLNWMAGGQAVREARGHTEGLAALVNTVARSAVVPDAALAVPVETRIELHAGTQLLAVLEVAGDQVRWTAPQGGASFVGTPQPPALAALRAALRRS